MRDELKAKCDLLVSNRKIINDTFPLDSGLMATAAAAFFTSKGVTADKHRIKECDEIIKKRVGTFSGYRSNIKIPLVCKMSLLNSPITYFERVRDVAEELNYRNIFSNECKILAAMNICESVSKNDESVYVKKTLEIYGKMKEEHKGLTSDDDMPFAAMLAVSGAEADSLIAEMEKCFKILEENFHDSNAVQALSHVLSLYPDDAENKCNEVVRLYNGLKDAKHRYGNGRELATLGTLSLLNLPMEETVQCIVDVDEYLRNKKGFGDFLLGQPARRQYAAMMVLDAFGEEKARNSEIIIGNTLARTIAIEVCMFGCMVASASSITTT